MIELYHNGMSTCSQKVRITLAEKGQKFASHHFNLRARDQHNPDYIALNPNGVVPTIIHDGKVVYESAVIDEYLDTVFPDPSLRPNSPYERAKMRIWVKQLDEGLHAASATISACIAFRYQFMEGKTSDQLKETLDGYVDPVKRERMTENVMKGVDSTFFKPAINRVIKMLDDMETVLQENSWLAGDTFSLADIAFTPYVNRVFHLQQDWLLESRPNTRNWFGRVCERPSFKVAMEDWFIDDFLTLMEAKGQESQEGVKAIVSEI
ncbi:MAG: glutathione S-transferase family protein [Pseudomonadota bacterium]|nr:glutathione S-transferase family protein [Pseudomonadota bacterium]